MPMTVETGLPQLPAIENEPVLSYAPGSPERAALESALQELAAERIELPLVIGGRELRTGRLEPAIMPHRHAHVLADAHLANASEVNQAIEAALRAAEDWGRASWTDRAAVFLKAADLLSGPWRARLNAATMLGQSKTAHQAEIDSAAELADFWRFNARFMLELYAHQPASAPGSWNRVDYRPLEGFVFAASPFNFTAIAGNLPGAPALMGNTVVWKPSASAKYSAHFLMQLLQEAGLPEGVINLVYGKAAEVADICLGHRALAGVHFTGSTSVFNHILQRVAGGNYRHYPRVVGETGGKNFIVAHPSADVPALAVAIIRGGYEYQGQKCSAASRIFVPQVLWPGLKERLLGEIATIRMGDVADFRNFMGAVINEEAFRKHSSILAEAGSTPGLAVIAGGTTSGEEGYFVAPTLLESDDPASRHMTEEFFGPIVTVHVYPDDRYEPMLQTIDQNSDYGLTGAVFATERRAIQQAVETLRHAAGNFYVNDKPTGAVVGQQPFGGARASGTNDKAGSMWNLARWVSPRTIKETFTPPGDYRYPFMG
jgi:1-pyrroline-5-carboxylate dehydrogenase